MNFRIERWNGQSGVAETLAAWHVREWAGLFAGWDESVARSEFQAQLRHAGLPATWLAYADEALIGSISALLEDHEDYYANAGWLLHERRQLHGQTVAVMWQDLSSDAGA